MLVVEIIDHDEIEVGIRGHLAGAEPAEREDRGLGAADAAMRGGKVVLHPGVHGADQHVGKPRKHIAGLLGGHRARRGFARRSGTCCSWPNSRIASRKSS